VASPRSAAPTDDRQWRYRDVGCARCGAIVAVAKFSLQHTSIQWSQEAVLRCAEFADEVAAGQTSALIATCASLRSSIDDALNDGRIVVAPP
jgi:hypothetical protein